MLRLGLALFAAASLFAQAPLVSLRGTLKSMDKKEIVIQSDEDQPISIHRTRHTKIEPGRIPPGTRVIVDTRKDPSGLPEAVRVSIENPKK